MNSEPPPDPIASPRWRTFPRFFSLHPRRRWRSDPHEGYLQQIIDRRVAIVGLAAMALGLVVLAVPPTARLIRRYHAKSLAEEAVAAVEARDWKRARAKALAASQLAPGIPAARIARARMLQGASPEQEVTAWEEVLDHVRPEQADHRVRYARALARAGRTADADAVWQKLPEADRATGPGRVAEALVAMQRGRTAQAEGALREAMRLLPAETDLKLLLANLLLRGPGAKALEGVTLLEALQGDAELGQNAARMLLEYFARAADWGRARPLAERLAAEPDAPMAAQLQLAQVLAAQPDPPALEALLDRLPASALTSAPDAAVLMDWLVQSQRWERATALFKAMSVPERRSAALVPTLAELWERTGRVDLLRSLLRDDDWDGAPLLRQAYLARAADLEGNAAQRATFWGRALAAAKSSKENLAMFLALAARWNWPSEQLELHRLIAAIPPPSLAQLRAWRQLATANRATTDIFECTKALLEAGEASPDLKNDFAATAFLLGRDLPRAHALALENLRARQSRPEIIATWATSLRLQNRPAEALAALERITPDPNQPGVELERALALAALGRGVEARAAAARVRPELLSDEETALLRPWRQ